MMLLNVFSKPLHIPEAFQWGLIIGVFIPLALTFYFIRQQKLEGRAQPVPGEAAVLAASKQQQGAKKRLVLLMVLGSAVGLCSPLWLPITGISLGLAGNLVCGVISAAMVCAICGLRLKKI